MTCFELAVFSLGASGAALASALYIIRHPREAPIVGPVFPTVSPSLLMPKVPVQAPKESIGLRLKRKIDRE